MARPLLSNTDASSSFKLSRSPPAFAATTLRLFLPACSCAFPFFPLLVVSSSPPHEPAIRTMNFDLSPR